MSDMQWETKKARSILKRKHNELRKLGYESFMAGHGVKVSLESQKINNAINMITRSIDQQASSGTLSVKHRSEEDAVKKDFIFTLHSKG